MIDAIRKALKLLAGIVAICLLSSSSRGGALPKLDEAAPWFAANNVPDPQVKLAGAIMLLFAAGLSLLAVGYVVDSIRSDVPEIR